MKILFIGGHQCPDGEVAEDGRLGDGAAAQGHAHGRVGGCDRCGGFGRTGLLRGSWREDGRKAGLGVQVAAEGGGEACVVAVERDVAQAASVSRCWPRPSRRSRWRSAGHGRPGRGCALGCRSRGLLPSGAAVLVGVAACFLQVRPYCCGIEAEQFGDLGGGPAVEGEGEDLALARGQSPQHVDDVLFLQPCLGFCGAGQQGGGLGDLGGGLLAAFRACRRNAR